MRRTTSGSPAGPRGPAGGGASIGMGTVRTFVAVEVPEEVRSQIHQAMEPLRQALPGVRWVAGQNLHLTVKFLGNLERERLDRVLSVTSQKAEAFGPFALSFSGLGAFPNERHPRVVWVGVAEGSGPLTALQGAIEAALVEAGFPKEDQPFRPHLTVGRARSKQPIRGAEEALRRVGVRSDARMVDCITVFGSDLTPQGPVYTALGRYRLRESAV